MLLKRLKESDLMPSFCHKCSETRLLSENSVVKIVMRLSRIRRDSRALTMSSFRRMRNFSMNSNVSNVFLSRLLLLVEI